VINCLARATTLLAMIPKSGAVIFPARRASNTRNYTAAWTWFTTVISDRLNMIFVVAPGTNPGVIRLAFKGVRNTRLDARGDLVLGTGCGEIRQKKPVIYQEEGGAKPYVEGRYFLEGGHTVGFEIGKYDKSKRLVIDPTLVYSSYLGGTFDDFGHGIAVDDSGNVYIAGETSSVDFL
jgi:hypothetical protein